MDAGMTAYLRRMRRHVLASVADARTQRKQRRVVRGRLLVSAIRLALAKEG